jgi:hypothetical protein
MDVNRGGRYSGNLGLMQNPVRADPSTPGAARPTLRTNGTGSESCGVEACRQRIYQPLMFRLRLQEPALSEVEGLNTNGF